MSIRIGLGASEEFTIRPSQETGVSEGSQTLQRVNEILNQ